MNTFSVQAINLRQLIGSDRQNTTSAQRFVASPFHYLPELHIVLSSRGKDWLSVLEQLTALKSKSFYEDAPDRPVEFSITFDFGYSHLPLREHLDFMDAAKLAL